MALDGIYLYHLKNEIEAFAVGSRIEKIYQPTKEELVFSLRSREGAKSFFFPVKRTVPEFTLPIIRPKIHPNRQCFACFSESI